MRGKPVQRLFATCEHRITPAHAGKTKYIPALLRIAEDHPRACGENRTCRRVRRFRPGSPPRMRGKQPVFGINVHAVRITPAHAGKTGVRNGLCTGRQDHPRACGENRALSVVNSDIFGSPPRMRGKLDDGDISRLRDRITPAHAGKTRRRTIANTCPEDHPRACGEN